MKCAVAGERANNPALAVNDIIQFKGGAVFEFVQVCCSEAHSSTLMAYARS
jgi:hypothetical protein